MGNENNGSKTCLSNVASKHAFQTPLLKHASKTMPLKLSHQTMPLKEAAVSQNNPHQTQAMARLPKCAALFSPLGAGRCLAGLVPNRASQSQPWRSRATKESTPKRSYTTQCAKTTATATIGRPEPKGQATRRTKDEGFAARAPENNLYLGRRAV